MIIIIDAYNLLYAISERTKKLRDTERNQFIKELGAYARHKKHKLIVVFDGGDYSHPVKEKKWSIEVVYSGVNQTADEYIKKYLLNNRALDNVVVSSDREINDYAQNLSVPSIEVHAFFELVRKALRASSDKFDRENAVKTTATSDIIGDRYMLEALKNIPQKDEDFIRKEDRVHAKKASKHDRVLLKKLSKL